MPYRFVKNSMFALRMWAAKAAGFRRTWMLMTLLLCGLYASSSFAECNGLDQEPVDIVRGDKKIAVTLCLDERREENGMAVFRLALHITGPNIKSPIDLTIPLDVEGNVRGVSIDSADYPINAQTLVFGLRVDARMPGAMFDQYSTDLYLIAVYPSKGAQLVFTDNVKWASWGRNCETEVECPEKTTTNSIVIVSPTATKGFRDLIVKSKSTSKKSGTKERPRTNRISVRYIWNGHDYEKVDAPH